MCRFQVVDSVSKCFGFPVLMVKDGVSTKRDFYHSSSLWFLLFICLHPCTETLLRQKLCLRQLVKDTKYQGGWQQEVVTYFISVPSLLFKLPLCFQVVDILWCKFLQFSPHSIIYNANLHNAQHSFSPGHTAFSTKFIFMLFN